MSLVRTEEDPRLRRSFVIACAVIGALLTALSMLRHYTFHSSVYDVGIFNQVLWNTAHGMPFESSISHMSYLGDHFSPTFGLLAPIEWLPRPIDLLLIAQAFAVPLVAWNMYRLARLHLSQRGAWLIGMGTLLCPALYCPTLADLHPEPFMAVALSYALLALDQGSELRAALWLLLVLGGKEDTALLLCPFGIILALDARTRRFGVGVAVLSLAYMIVVVSVVMPLFRPPAGPDAPWLYLGRFNHLGASPKEIVVNVLRHPLHALIVSTTQRRLATIAALFVPFALAPLRSRRVLAIVPFAAAHYLSNRTAEFTFPFHYLVPAIPVLVWAAIDGATSTIEAWPRVTAFCVLASGVLSIGWRFDPEPLTARPNQAALAAAIKVIPDGESVCVENWFGAHLSSRRDVDFCTLWEWGRDRYRYYGWPETSAARWQVFDLADKSREYPTLGPRMEALRGAGATVAYDNDGVVVLRVTDEVLARAPHVEVPPPSPAFAP